MSNNTSLTNLRSALRDLLVEVYNNPAAIRRVAADADIPVGRVSLDQDAINNWHSLLMEAENLEQVDRLVEIVLREYGRNSGLRSAIEAYRYALRSDPSNNVPVVVVAMTATEAAELADETVFTNWPTVDGRVVPQRGDELVNFRQIREILPDTFPSAYQSKRDDWAPYFADISIQDKIEEIARNSKYNVQFFSERLFAEERAVRQRAAYFLQLTGCILIVDAISTLHPKLNYLLEISGLVGLRQTIATLVVSPLDHTRDSHIQIIERDILNSNLLAVLMQRIEMLDLSCEFSIGGDRALRRWLKSILPGTADLVRKEIADNSQLALFTNSMDTPKRGVQRHFTG